MDQFAFRQQAGQFESVGVVTQHRQRQITDDKPQKDGLINLAVVEIGIGELYVPPWAEDQPDNVKQCGLGTVTRPDQAHEPVDRQYPIPDLNATIVTN